jgi:hypothetical protein
MPLPLRSNINTFQPGSRVPRDGLYANTDEMKREADQAVAACTFRLVQFKNESTNA